MSPQNYNDGNNVLIRFNHSIGETEKAHCLALSPEDDKGVWLPKSQIAHIDLDIGEVWIPMWLAKKKGLDYD